MYELRVHHQVSAGMRVLSAEGGSEGVHVSQCAGVRLHVQLPRHREAAAAPEEVLDTNGSIRGRVEIREVEFK